MLVRNTFRNVLYAHPEAGGYPATDFDALFSAAFAQTLSFGLLLVRESTNAAVGEDAWRQMPDEHPLLKAALRVLSEDEVTSQIGIGFEVMRDCVNSFAPEILALQPGGRDPILYFYEDFLKTFDPAARERYGVYYTPLEVVRYMAGALDRALRDNLGTQGLRDPAVRILDPATGTGTFLLGVAERVRDQVMADEGGVAASLALGDLATRMFGFELLVGPYAVAHYRLHHALRVRPADDDEDAPQPVRLPRLGVYLADTLAEPNAVTPVGQLGIQGIPIDDERHAANRIKAQQQILAIIGNPPYKRLAEGENETLVGRWMDGIWDDLKRPVQEAGQGGQLNTFPEFSVAFWRWAIWKLFEADNAPQRGVIAYITNRKFLTGWPYAGLRQMMRERFDRIEVIDLRGDVRAGPRGDVDADQGVFNIMVGTAITIAIADGSKAEGVLADVVYTDCWKEGRFGKRPKLDWLTSMADAGKATNQVAIDRGLLEDWRPEPFDNGEWLSIREIFRFSLSGLQTKRDHFIYSPDRQVLADRIQAFRRMTPADAKSAFHDSRDRLWTGASAIPFDPNLISQVSYRPFDQRSLYNHRAYGDFLRPELQAAWGARNVGFYSMPFGVGAGPAVWCHGSIPDYHSFSGRGGYAFPLYDRRAGPNAFNLSPVLISALAEAYGAEQAPGDIFDAMLCLLSASSYARRFAEDLEDTFPHVPFPADPAVFARAAAVGREVRALEAFQRAPAPAFRTREFCKLVGEPD
ncbi:type ISP restriction/modification enzyme, partial [Novosphingobium sp.]|uniref:type ISP restriction/modification enzyme n=1 Tax=Novosphingobium sp. TaxID=1874826 RepID=UPI0025EFFBFF